MIKKRLKNLFKKMVGLTIGAVLLIEGLLLSLMLIGGVIAWFEVDAGRSFLGAIIFGYIFYRFFKDELSK